MTISLLVLAAVVSAGEVRARPAIAKDGLQKSAWVQLNPWFPVDMSPVYDLGGPNVPYQVCTDTNSSISLAEASTSSTAFLTAPRHLADR